MLGLHSIPTSRSIARHLVTPSKDKFRSFVSVDNNLLLSRAGASNADDDNVNSNTSSTTIIGTYAKGNNMQNLFSNRHQQIVSKYQSRIPHLSFFVNANSTNLMNSNAGYNIAHCRNFSSSAPLSSTNNNGQITPEEAMKQFEEQANLNANANTTSTSTTDVLSTIGTNAWEATWWPQDQMVDFINYVHDVSGLNYALTIGAITLTFRTVMVPIFIKAQQNSSRMAHVKPEMDVLKAKIDKLDPKNLQLQQKYAQEMQELFRKYDVNPLRAIILPIIQMPAFMSMFFALKKMPEHFPDELANGGILWFTDLTAPDPLYILPIMSGMTFFAMMELGKKQMLASSPEQGQIMLNVFRGMAVLIVPFSMYFPTAVLCYWTANNTFSLAQSVVMNQASVKKALGIWDLPKPVPGAVPQKGIMESLQDSLKDQRKDSASSNLKQRIEMHNAAVEKKKKRKKNR